MPRIEKSVERDSRLLDALDWEGRDWGLMATVEYRVSFWDDKSVVNK